MRPLECVVVMGLNFNDYLSLRVGWNKEPGGEWGGNDDDSPLNQLLSYYREYES